MNTVSVENLTFCFGAEKVLDDVSAVFRSGELTGIIGPNGSGKTTLIRCISGYLTPNAGGVRLGTEDVRAFSAQALAKRMALVPQSSYIEYDFTVEDIVLMGRHAHLRRLQRAGKHDLDIAKEAMTWAGIWDMRKRSALTLSGGEWQRMIIARALAQQSDILLLDEPVSSLDIRHQMDVLSLVRTLAGQRGITVICVLHDLNLAAHYCSRLVLMKKGRTIFAGDAETVLNTSSIHSVYGVEADVVRDAGRLYIHPHYT